MSAINRLISLLSANLHLLESYFQPHYAAFQASKVAFMVDPAAPFTKVEPFGMRAARLGLVTAEQIETALAAQRRLDSSGQHKLLGMIMVDLGMLSTTQLLAVLRTYQQD